MSTSEHNIKKELVKAQEHYKSQNYEKAEAIYNQCFNENPEEFGKWDKIFYAWSIYKLKIKNTNNEDILKESVKKIQNISQQTDYSNGDGACAYTQSILKIRDYFSSIGQYNEVIYWSKQLNPKLLSSNPVSYTDKLFSSKKEKWYLEITKALLNIEDYENCIKYSKEALDEINDFTNNNDIWFKYRMGKSYKEIGNYDTAIKMQNEALKIKNEWYIQKEIAENYYYKKDYENALKYAVSSALNNKQIDMKINLYSLIQELLEMKGENEYAAKHAYLIYSIKYNKGQEIPEDIEEIVTESNFDLENNKYMEIEKDLRKYWAEIQFQDQQLNYGTIEKIFPHGKSGFIRSDDNQSYFFNMFDYLGDKNTIKLGDYVSFYLKKGYDKKKEKESMNAVYIKLEL